MKFKIGDKVVAQKVVRVFHPATNPYLKETKIQKILLVYLRVSKKLIEFLTRKHGELAMKGYEQHSCWAGGFSQDEGIVSQPCDACDPFYAEEDWANKLKKGVRNASRQ
jgi:hypothetical protein